MFCLKITVGFTIPLKPTSTELGVLSGESENVVSMTSIISGAYGLSDGYIYFFAQIEQEQSDSESEESEETDENHYLYRAALSGDGGCQLIGKSK